METSVSMQQGPGILPSLSGQEAPAPGILVELVDEGRQMGPPASHQREDGVPEAATAPPPTTVPPPTSAGLRVSPPAVLNAAPFHAGYVDCAAEAVRFLLEVENIAESSDVIQRLRQHLDEEKPAGEEAAAAVAPPSGAEAKQADVCISTCLTAEESAKKDIENISKCVEEKVEIVDNVTTEEHTEDKENTQHGDQIEEGSSTDTSSLSLNSSGVSATSTDSGVDTASEWGMPHPLEHSSPLTTRLPSNKRRRDPSPPPGPGGQHSPVKPVKAGRPDQPASPTTSFIQGLASVVEANPAMAALTRELFELLEGEELPDLGCEAEDLALG